MRRPIRNIWDKCRLSVSLAAQPLAFGGALLLLVLAISACSQATPTPGPAPLTIDALRNAEYQTEFTASGKAKLTNGSYEAPAAPGSASKITIKLLDTFATGDLNGDGVLDSAVVLASNTGGSGTFIHLAAVLNKDGKPSHVGSVLLGDRVLVKSLSIIGATISVDMVKQGPTDPLCCPTQQVVQKYKLEGGLLVQSQ